MKIQETALCRVYQNPSRAELPGLLEQTRLLRGKLCQRDLFVWDATLAHHGEMAFQLGIPSRWSDDETLVDLLFAAIGQEANPDLDLWEESLTHGGAFWWAAYRYHVTLNGWREGKRVALENRKFTWYLPPDTAVAA